MTDIVTIRTAGFVRLTDIHLHVDVVSSCGGIKDGILVTHDENKTGGVWSFADLEAAYLAVKKARDARMIPPPPSEE